MWLRRLERKQPVTFLFVSNWLVALLFWLFLAVFTHRDLTLVGLFAALMAWTLLSLLTIWWRHGVAARRAAQEL